MRIRQGAAASPRHEPAGLTALGGERRTAHGRAAGGGAHAPAAVCPPLPGLQHLGLRLVGSNPTPNGTFDAISSVALLVGLVLESEGPLPDRRHLTTLQRLRFLALRSSNVGDAPLLAPAPAGFPAGLLCCTFNCVRRVANFQLGSVRFGAAYFSGKGCPSHVEINRLVESRLPQLLSALLPPGMPIHQLGVKHSQLASERLSCDGRVQALQRLNSAALTQLANLQASSLALPTLPVCLLRCWSRRQL